MGVLYAIMACVAYASTPLLASRALASGRIPVVTGALMSASISLAILVPVALVAGGGGWDPSGLYWFAAAGLLAPGMFRLLFYRSLTLGSVGGVSVVASTYPAIAVVAAVFLQDDRLNAARWAGLVLTLVGIMGIKSRNATDGAGGMFRFAFLLALAAAGVRALSELLRREGAVAVDSVLPGTFTMNAAALLVFLFAALSAGKPLFPKPSEPAGGGTRRREVATFVAEGALLSLAWLLGNLALQRAPISVVTPIIGASPAFTVLLSLLVKGSDQPMPAKSLAYAFIAVLGVVLVAAGSS